MHLTVISLLVLACGSTVWSLCTPGCKCEHLIDYAQLDCDFSGKDADAVIKNISSTFNTTEMDLIISNMAKKIIPKNYFGDLNLKGLVINYADVSEIQENAFEGQKNSLNSLLLLNTKLTAVPNLSNLNVLMNLKIFNNTIAKIRKNDFKGIGKSLYALSLSHNGLEEVEDGALLSLVRLEDLDLSSNSLAKFPDECFPLRLVNLDLKSNKLTEIPNAVLKIGKGTIISLINNEIKALPEKKTKALLMDEKTLILKGNPLECGCDLKWLAKLEAEDDEAGFYIFGKCRGNNARQGAMLGELAESLFNQCK